MKMNQHLSNQKVNWGGQKLRSLATVTIFSATMLFTACEKEEAAVLNPAQGVNSASSNNQSESLSAESAQGYLRDYAEYQKKGLSREKALLEMPLIASVDLAEVVLNASRAVKYRDKDYIKPQYDSLTFTVDATKNLLGTFVSATGLYQQIENIGRQIDQIAVGAQRQFIAIDVEPFRFVDGQLEFTVTVINALVIPRYSYDVEELLTYEWKWGSSSANSPIPFRWSCEPVPDKFRFIAGACQVAKLFIEEYLNPPVLDACVGGYYSTRLKALFLRYRPEFDQYYDNNTGLNFNTPFLQETCISPAELRNRYILEFIRAINTEIDAFPNPFRLSYGRGRGVVIGAGSTDPQVSDPSPSHSMDVIIDDPQCAAVLTNF